MMFSEIVILMGGRDSFAGRAVVAVARPKGALLLTYHYVAARCNCHHHSFDVAAPSSIGTTTEDSASAY